MTTREGKLRLGVLISGSGTNLQAIIDAIEAGELDARIAVVVSNHASARGLDRARKHGIAAVHVDAATCDGVQAYNAKIRDTLLAHEVDYVVMAGYMRLLGACVLDAFPSRVLNIHPALLPSFAGADGIGDAFRYGVKVTGVTVHFANEVFDEGPIVAQQTVEIAENDTLESLEAKIHAAEHELYPRVLQMLAEDRIRVDGRRVHIV